MDFMLTALSPENQIRDAKLAWWRNVLPHAEIAAYNNVEVLGCQTEFSELNRTILLPTLPIAQAAIWVGGLL
jgi:hypothetical protein